MAGKLITIQEAAKLSDKSTQTIRRLIKTNKIKCKKTRTPQGFNYNVYIDSLAKYYSIDISKNDNVSASVKKQNTVFSLGIKPDPIRTKKKTSTMKNEPIPIEINNVIEGITIEETIDELDSHLHENNNADENDGAHGNDKNIKNDKVKVEVVNEDSTEEFIAEKANKKATKKHNVETLQFASLMQQMLNQHKEDKERLFIIIEQFQERTVILEERLKKLEAPKKQWWKLW